MQSGISASKELHTEFQRFLDDSATRGLLVEIQKESLVPSATIPAQGSFDDDVAQLDVILAVDKPAYILLRRFDDASNPAPYIAVTYVPDHANVRQKMLFASTRTTLTRELGSEKFGESIFATEKSELTAEGFRKHDAHMAKPAPLTEEEESLQTVRLAELEASQGTAGRKNHVSSGVAFPLSQEAIDALKGLTLSNGFISLVQLALNPVKETIELANATSSNVGDFTKVIPNDTPRYSFFVFKHTFAGVEQSPIVFIYTCPPESKIKERMLYASCRANVVTTAERECGLKIEKKLEAAMPTEIGEDHLMEEFHPQKEEKKSFARPKRPGRR
ncbi:actin depolymerizing protein [Ascodesmis nigricans]|uniref:Twinfilin n=1 Tax=Ascodesmis nigricans TaxID=341454 RepID=A0A4S2N802_9PEZI|nr:actin depolymerizing protein [Ascodesmis nigricans]